MHRLSGNIGQRVLLWTTQRIKSFVDFVLEGRFICQKTLDASDRHFKDHAGDFAGIFLSNWLNARKQSFTQDFLCVGQVVVWVHLHGGRIGCLGFLHWNTSINFVYQSLSNLLVSPSLRPRGLESLPKDASKLRLLWDRSGGSFALLCWWIWILLIFCTVEFP